MRLDSSQPQVICLEAQPEPERISFRSCFDCLESPPMLVLMLRHVPRFIAAFSRVSYSALNFDPHV